MGMGERPISEGAGCLVCLIQASESMRDTAYSGPITTKIAAATRFVERLLRELTAAREEQSVLTDRPEVGVVSYAVGTDGRARFRALLRGSRSSRPLIPLHQVRRSAGADGEPDRFLRDSIEPQGRAAGRLALTFATSLLSRWVDEHPGAVPPVVIHCTDGEAPDGPIAGEVAALSDAIPGVVLVHCLFQRGLASSALVPISKTPCGDLWAMSSPYPDRGASMPGAPEPRSLFVNKLSAAKMLGQLIRQMWTPATSPVPEDAADVSERPAAAAPPTPECEPEPDAPPDVDPAGSSVTEVTGPPRLEMRAYWMPKRGNSDGEWEDGFEVDEAGGLFAVADGASDGIFSKQWADLLLKSFVSRPIPLDEPDAVEAWLREQRRAWFEAIRYPEQRWSVQMKVDRSCGAATFLGFRLDPPHADFSAPGSGTGWTVWVVGDICLFHVREGRLIASFPLGKSADFGVTPALYQSKPLRPTPEAAVMRGELLPDDLILVATDAVAGRLLAEVESGDGPRWERFWTIDEGQWRQEIESLRDSHAIVNDDCTLLVLRAARNETNGGGAESRGGGASAGGNSSEARDQEHDPVADETITSETDSETGRGDAQGRGPTAVAHPNDTTTETHPLPGGQP